VTRPGLPGSSASVTTGSTFDLIELGGDDLRREPLEVRKATLASVLAKAGAGIRFNEHLDYDDGSAVFQHACRMGLEGIVSKRKDSPYRSGRTKPTKWRLLSGFHLVRCLQRGRLPLLRQLQPYFPLPWLVSVLSGIRAVLCKPIEDARDVHLDPLQRTLRRVRHRPLVWLCKIEHLHDNRPMPGPFPQELNTLSRLRLMCSRCTRTHLGSAKAPGVAYLGGLFFSDASAGFPEYGRHGSRQRKTPPGGPSGVCLG
jgi:ATP dependent DNA ligase domain